MKKLILFDFDGTITRKDTLFEFIRFYHGTVKLFFGLLMLSPWLGLLLLKLIPNWQAKEKLLQWFFKGEPLTEFNRKSKLFSKTILPQLVREKALRELNHHLNKGATVVVISASAENWVKPWCLHYNLNCIATVLETIDNTITGRIKGFNCYGAEKARRIRECYNLADFDEVIAFGDSRGDFEMLALAHKKFYKPFRKNLMVKA